MFKLKQPFAHSPKTIWESHHTTGTLPFTYLDGHQVGWPFFRVHAPGVGCCRVHTSYFQCSYVKSSLFIVAPQKMGFTGSLFLPLPQRRRYNNPLLTPKKVGLVNWVCVGVSLTFQGTHLGVPSRGISGFPWFFSTKARANVRGLGGWGF